MHETKKKNGKLESFETTKIVSMYVDETGIDLFIDEKIYKQMEELLKMQEEVSGNFKMLKANVEVRVCKE